MRTADRVAMDPQEQQRVMALASDFPAAWRSSSTPQRERKRMLALLIEDVTLTKGQQVTAAVRFRGGACTTLTLPRPLTAPQLRATHDDVRQELDALLDQYTDAEVAHMLNERGRQTGAGDAFDATSVRWVRFSAKLKSLKQRMLDDGWLTSKQVSAKLGGACRATLGRWRRQGRIEGRICNGRGEWLYRLKDELEEAPAHTASAPTPGLMATSTAGDAV